LHGFSYGTGSGQQSVTCYEGGDDANSYWIIHGAYNKKCARGTPLKSGDTIRLQHMQTRHWLHSHLHKSPLSGNQEVSCFGSDAQSDTGDNWKVEVEKGTDWNKDGRVKLLHVDTSTYLGSHDKKFSRPIAGQQEVYAKKTKDGNTNWAATEGVYYPVPGSGKDEDGEL